MNKFKDILNELSYKDYVEDDSTTFKQKINNNINEINKMCSQIETLLRHASKLKSETNSDQSIFWKSSVSKFGKIGERLNRIHHKTLELSK